MKEIKNRYDSVEKVRKKLSNFQDTIQLIFADSGKKIVFDINKDQGMEIKPDEEDENAPVKIEFISEKVILDLFNKELGAVKAYSSGKVKRIL